MKNILKKPLFNRLATASCAIASGIIILGCATPEDLGRMQWDINDLRAEMKKLKQSSGPSKTPEAERKLLEVAERQEATSKTLSDLLIQVQSLTSELQALNGRFEEARFAAQQNSAELQGSKDILAGKINELEQSVNELKKKVSELQASAAAAAAADKSADTGQTEKGAPEKSSAGKADAAKIKDLYMSGYQAFTQGKTAEAREKLSSLVKDFPDNEYSDNARFWIAESYYKDGSYEDAILAYEELFKKHPKSSKIPGAMLKQGLAFFELKDKKTGEIILNKLIEKYPDSEQARLAKKKLGMTRVPPKKK